MPTATSFLDVLRHYENVTLLSPIASDKPVIIHMIARESCQVNVNKLFQFEVGQPGDSFGKLVYV